MNTREFNFETTLEINVSEMADEILRINFNIVENWRKNKVKRNYRFNKVFSRSYTATRWKQINIC